MKRFLSVISLSMAAIGCFAQLPADTVSAWTLSRNHAGLTTISSTMSDARLFISGEQGKMHSPNDAERSVVYGAEASSFYRLNSQTVFSGAISYSHFFGKKMGGSAMTLPYDAPFNITEYDDSNRGDKAMDKYRLSGAVGSMIGNGFSIGAGVDYVAANYAKRKDPRHKNSYMNLLFSPGFTWKRYVNKDDANPVTYIFGANYIYQRSVESLSFRVYGRQDKVAHYLIDYGGYFGIDEQADGNGYTDPSAEKPLYDERHGASVQMEQKFGERFSWFAQLSLIDRHGHYGEKSPNLLSLSQHHATEYDVLLRLSLLSSSNKHFLTLSAEHEKMKNYERVSRTVTGEGGLTDVEYYGKREAGLRETTSLSASYDGYMGRVDVKNISASRLHIGAAIDYLQINRKASVYPHYRHQQLKSYTISALAASSLPLHSGLFSIGISPYLSFGSNSSDDGLYNSNYEEATPPVSSGIYMQREAEYLTATKFGITLSGKHELPLPPSLSAYIRLDYGFNRAFSIKALEGTTRHILTLSIGCRF